MLRALVFFTMAIWAVSVVVAEESLTSFRKDVVTMEILSEKPLIAEPVALKDSFADDETIAPPTEGAIHANRNDHQYYLPSCGGYAEVNSKDVVPFPSEEIATEAGYQRAQSCS